MHKKLSVRVFLALLIIELILPFAPLGFPNAQVANAQAANAQAANAQVANAADDELEDFDDENFDESYDEANDDTYGDDYSESGLDTLRYTNEETGYEVHFMDYADLISDDSEDALIEKMIEVTEYGNVCFLSNPASNYVSSTPSYTEEVNYSLFGQSSSTTFCIDMANRKIYIFSNGEIFDNVTSAYANIITDNIYSYATGEDYYTCAYNAYEQELAILAGESIRQPMRYITTILLALMFALIINYFLVMSVFRAHEPSNSELVKNVFSEVKFENSTIVKTYTTKKYDPPSKGSSSSGGGGGGGGGGHSF